MASAPNVGQQVQVCASLAKGGNMGLDTALCPSQKLGESSLTLEDLRGRHLASNGRGQLAMAANTTLLKRKVPRRSRILALTMRPISSH